MENLDIGRTKISLYCWIVLTVFIGATAAFFINFYNKTVDEISRNTINVNNRINYVQE